MRGLANASSAAPLGRPAGLARRPLALTVAFLTSSALAFLLVLALGAGHAHAASDTYIPIGSFGSQGSGNGQFNDAGRIAVDNTTGNVLVVDSGNNRVQVFKPGADSATYLTKFGAGILSGPIGIAIDQSNGAVYVSSATNQRIVKFISDGAPTPTYSEDATFTSPAPGTEAGQVGSFLADLAVDPTSGDLLVADRERNIVQRFQADGSFVSAFDGSTSPSGAFTGLESLAVDSAGDVLIADTTRRFERFDAAGLFLEDLEQPAVAGAPVLAVDPGSDYVLITMGTLSFPPLRFAILDGGTKLNEVLVSDFAHQNHGWQIDGIAVSGVDGRAYVVGDTYSEIGTPEIQVLRPGTLPALTIESPTAVTARSATLHGMVNAGGSSTKWRFEYSADGKVWTPAPYPSLDPVTGTSPVPVAFSLDGLQPNTAYEVRLAAENADGQKTSGALSFTTSQAGPSVHSIFVAPRTTTSARLNARINPLGLASTYYFEYGETAAYGLQAPALPAAVGTDDSQHLASQTLTGLAPGTTYHYRAIAESSAGTTESADRTFTTRTAAELAPPARGIELVNQPDKGGQAVQEAYPTARGDAVVWTTVGGAPGSPSGQSLFVSKRTLATQTGWESFSLLPPLEKMSPAFAYGRIPIAVSPDGSQAIVGSRESSDIKARIERSGLGGAWSLLYDGSYRGLAGTVLHGSWGNVGFQASSDFSRAFVNTSDSYDPAHVGNAENFNVYEIGDGAPELISRLPDGSVPVCGVGFQGFSFKPTYGGVQMSRWISDDGTRVLFQSSGDQCDSTSKKYATLYLRDLSTSETVSLSGPQPDLSVSTTMKDLRASDVGAYPIGVNSDLSTVAFITKSQADPADENETMDAYRWEAGKEAQCLSCESSTTVESAVASDDVSHVYFTSTDRLLAGEGEQYPQGGAHRNLYVWNDGTLNYVAPVGEEELWRSPESLTLTPDGTVAVFRSDAPGVTADDPGSCGTSTCTHLYRYAESDESVECLDCAPPGVITRSGADANDYGDYMPGLDNRRTLSVDGRTVIFPSRTALVPADINGGIDIYQWRNGQLSLITDGSTEFAGLALVGISLDGTDIFFQALGPRLTGFETDRQGQLYDARAGGGFVPPDPPAVCTEDACQGPLEPVPSLLGSGSQSFTGPGNEAPGKEKRAKKKRGKAKKDGRKKARHGKRHHKQSTGRRG